MEKLSDVLLEALTPGPLDLRMRPTGTEQRVTGLTFDVAEPPDYPVTIAADSDVLADYTIVDVEPETTRVVLGGGGEGVDRDFFAKVDGIREAERGGAIAIGETFVDGHVLRDAETGRQVCELERDDVEPLKAAGWRPPERFAAPGRDGKTAIHGIIVRPSNLDPASRRARSIERVSVPYARVLEGKLKL